MRQAYDYKQEMEGYGVSRLTPLLEHDLLLRSMFLSQHHRLCQDPKTQRSHRSTLDHSSPQLSGRRHCASRRERGTFGRARRTYPTQPSSWHGATPECLLQGSDVSSHPSTRAQNHRRVRERSSPPRASSRTKRDRSVSGTSSAFVRRRKTPLSTCGGTDHWEASPSLAYTWKCSRVRPSRRALPSPKKPESQLRLIPQSSQQAL